MNLYWTKALALALLVLSSIAIASEKDIYEATYTGTYKGFDITMKRVLKQHSNGTYSLTFKMSNFAAKISENSRFTIKGGKIVPQDYKYQRKILGSKKAEKLTFNQDNSAVTYYKNGKLKHTLKTNSSVLDPSVYQLQLQLDLSKKQKKGRYSYQLARREKIKQYDFRIFGEAEFTLQGKTYTGIKVVRQSEGLKKTEVLMLPELNYAIAQIKHTDKKGKSHTVTLSRVTNHFSLSQL